MRRLYRNGKGQFMVLMALGIVLMMILLTALLAYSSLSQAGMTKTDFRSKVIQISLNFRGALSIALSEVSQALELKSSARQYNITSLDEYPAAKDDGREFMADWQNTTRLQNSGLGLNLNLSNLNFECWWSSSQAYSKASANISFDILSYGLKGWREEAELDTHLSILGLNQSSLNNTSFFFTLTKENSLPINDLSEPFIQIFYNNTNNFFSEANSTSIKLYHVGDGKYLVKFASPNINSPPCIKMVLQDSRGIVVGTIPRNGVVLTTGVDNQGPRTLNVVVQPNPISLNGTVNLTAKIDDTLTGWSYIAAAEYFVDSTGANGTGLPMAAVDGHFNDSYSEDVEANINVTGWAIGSHTIYIHGKDSKNSTHNWGNFSSIILTVTYARQTIFYDDFTNGAFKPQWIDLYLADTQDSYPHPGGGKYARLKGSSGSTDGYAVLQISTTGYSSIKLSYWRSGNSLESDDSLRIQWRVGTSGSWITLEYVTDNSWAEKEDLDLGPSAENQPIIQIRFILQNCEWTWWDKDYGFIDDVEVTGIPLP